MKLPRRQFLHLAAGAAALPAVPRVAYAQAYPTRPVRIIAARVIRNFNVTGLSHQVGVDVSRTRINTRIMRNFRLGTLLPTQECVITF